MSLRQGGFLYLRQSVLYGGVGVVVGGIGIWVRSVLAYLDSLDNTVVRGWGCSLFWGWGECLGVDWGFYLYLGYSFSRDGSNYLLAKLVQGYALFWL